MGTENLAVPPPSTASGAVPAADGVLLTQPALAARLGRDPSQPRYRTESSLGLGASGTVYAVEDRNLSRVVALKILSDGQADPENISHFVDEAQIVASLAHPNVLPIYDLDVAGDGRVYFTMPRISGRSLGAAIETSSAQVRDPRITQASDVARIGVAVAQALACAHHQRIVHQDVKPDNIMLGEFGEVLLVDWGSAVRLTPDAKPKLYGTPLYMSPEQGRCGAVDERSDIYCLGATLFHAVLLRVPTWTEDSAEFWRRKRNGEVTWPTREERAQHPPALLDIICKCLAADPVDRYQRVEGLLKDLYAWQNGLAVTAHPETVPERIARWHRRHGRTLYISASLISLLVAVVLILYGERLEEMAHWGKPIIAGDFTSPLGPEWKLQEGGFTIKDGWLVSTGDGANVLLLDRRLHGATAIEYDGELLPGARPCDISLMWCRDRVLSDDGRSVRSLIDPTELQVGAFDNSGVMISNASGTLAYAPLRLVNDRPYHVRAEIEDDRMELWVDGQLQCSWQDPFPYQDGFLCLYGHYPLKAFSHLRIYTRGVAQKIPATGVGDACAARGDYQIAADEYALVADSHPRTTLGEEARYRQGLCFWRLHQEGQAMAVWQGLRAGRLGDRVRLHDLDQAFARKDQSAVCTGIAAMWLTADAEIRHALALSWARYVNQLRTGKMVFELQRYLDRHARLMADEHAVDGPDADALLATRHYQQVVDRFPNSRYSYASALSGLGRYQEVINGFPEYQWTVNSARLLAGKFELIEPGWQFLILQGQLLQARFQDILDNPNADPSLKVRSLMCLGRGQEALAACTSEDDRAKLLLILGRASEIGPQQAWRRELLLGDAQQALADCPVDSTEHLQARWRIALGRWIAGDPNAFEGLSVEDVHLDRGNDVVIAFYLWVMRPFLEELKGDREALSRACALRIADRPLIFQQRPCFDAQLLIGRIDAEVFLKQPAPIYARPRLELLQAMRAELKGDSDAAVAHYRRWQAAPAYECGDCPDPVLITLVAWRLQELVAAPSPAGVPAALR